MQPRRQKAFESYAKLRQVRIADGLRAQFTVCESPHHDTLPVIRIVNRDELKALMRRYEMHGEPGEFTLYTLAVKMMDEERNQLFGWLKPFGIRS